MEVILAALVLLALYLLEEQRMTQLTAWFQDFMDYLEQQQQGR